MLRTVVCAWALASALVWTGCATEVQVREEKPVRRAPKREAPKQEPGTKESSGEELTNEEIMATIFAPESLAPLQECLKAEIARNHELPQNVIVDFSIANDGTVGQVTMDDIRLQDGELQQCLREQLEQIHFRAYSGEVKNVTIPFRW